MPSERNDNTRSKVVTSKQNVKVGSADYGMTEITEDEMDPPYKTAKKDKVTKDVKVTSLGQSAESIRRNSRKSKLRQGSGDNSDLIELLDQSIT